jgi:tRNA modification GTPase
VSATIAAIATGRAPGGVGIVRLSGAESLAIAQALCPSLPASPEPRRAYFTALGDGRGRTLDQGLALYFQAPASFTGEDVVELHAHGGTRLLELLLAAVLAEGRARLAEPGEFTRRAFVNGRIDLSRAEAVADLVAADSEAAVRAAAAQVRGALSGKVGEVRTALLALYADLEAVLAFPDEASGAEEDAQARLAGAGEALGRLLRGAAQGTLLRRGARVVLFGPVNAGKSTLFNRLLDDERALVDAAPGTTRDLLEARLELEGGAVALVDGAGLREGAERIEALGIARVEEAVRGADLAVLLLPPEASVAEAERWAALAPPGALLRVRAQADRAGAPEGGGLEVSGLTGQGVEALRRALSERLFGTGSGEAAWVTSERHADALRRAAEALGRGEAALRVSTLEVVAGEVGAAVEALGEITGESAGEALLDEIFRRFCIGK